MTLTHQDRRAHILLPAVRSTRPSRVMQQARDVAHAIEPGGYISPDALRTFGSGSDGGMYVASHTASSSDTVNYATYLDDTLVLSAGLWRVAFLSGITGRLSGASNFNSQLLVDGTASSNYQIPLAAGDMATVWQLLTLDQVPGGSELAWAVQFRPSAGTATAEAGFLTYSTERIG